jgi:hypothetical protein
MTIRSSRLRASTVFTGQPAAPQHIAHFYQDDAQLLDTLSTFVLEGLQTGESVIVIATPEHEAALQSRLLEAGIDLKLAIEEDLYIALDAEKALGGFLVNGWPDGQRFADLVGKLMKRATAGQRPVRAFGEMVALLWARGQTGATVRLEDLWNQFSRSYSFPLLCAYPLVGLSKGSARSIEMICSAHAALVPEPGDLTEWESPVSAQAAD